MMTEIKKYAFLVVSLLLLACSGEDRTYEYEALTNHNHWIYDQMKDHYLWADKLKDPAWKQFFGDPAAFMKTLTAKANDKWSYVMVDTLLSDPYEKGNFNHNDTYGMDFVLMTDPTGQTTKQCARVVTIYPGSPAMRCGLVRGDFIVMCDSVKITQNSVADLQKGKQRKLQVCHLDVNLEDQTYFWRDTVTVTLPKSEYVEDVAYQNPWIYNVERADGSLATTAYMMCTRLTYSATEARGRGQDDRLYMKLMDSFMQNVKATGATELVLDLRLCNEADMEMVRRMASYIASPDCLDKTFLNTVRVNDSVETKSAVPFDRSVANLGLQRVFIITSSMTRGGAEWLIHGLKNLMGDRVVVIGDKTAGQNVMTSQVAYDYLIRLCPVVAYVANAEGDYSSYANGIEPDFYINELNRVQLGEYGFSDEILLNAALEMIAE